jgi:hypothetical protein
MQASTFCTKHIHLLPGELSQVRYLLIEGVNRITLFDRCGKGWARADCRCDEPNLIQFDSH